jgi:hypothetical protein
MDRGDGDGNGTIEVSELAAFVYAQVTAISENVFKQRQEPQVKITSNYALTRRTRVLIDDAPAIAMETKPTYQLTQTAQLQIKPANGATVVRSLSSKNRGDCRQKRGRLGVDRERRQAARLCRHKRSCAAAIAILSHVRSGSKGQKRKTSN